jgi:hypothetical protein
MVSKVTKVVSCKVYSGLPHERQRLAILAELIHQKVFPGGIWTEGGGKWIYAKEFVFDSLKFIPWKTAAQLVGMKPSKTHALGKL